MLSVVAAVIRQQDRVLISRRHANAHQGGLWEFPGGKQESGESAEQALIRELREELNIVPTQYRPMIQIPHHYPDKSVRLDVWEVTQWQGDPHGREGQPVEWVSLESLASYEFPAANQPIVTACQLPVHYLITPAVDDEQEFITNLSRALDSGINLVQFRQKELAADDFNRLAEAVIDICHRRGARVLLNADIDQIEVLGADGLQLNASTLMALQQRPLGEKYLVAASCHDENEIEKAGELNLDFALLSPVQATASHPDTKPLGWQRFAEIVSQATLPVYALGGVSREDVKTAWQYGGQGVSAIRALWVND